MFLVVDGKAGRPDTRQFPTEGGWRGNGLGRLLLEDGATDNTVEFLLGQPRCEDLADGRAVNGSCGPDLLDDADGTLGLALRDNRHDAVPEDCEARAFTRAATQLVKKRHRYLGKLLLGPGASSETEELGRERVGPGVTILNKIAEFNERTKKMIGCTPRQCGLACDLGKRRRAADGSNYFDDA